MLGFMKVSRCLYTHMHAHTHMHTHTQNVGARRPLCAGRFLRRA